MALLPKTGVCFGVPRGGGIVAALTGRQVERPEDADFIVDDIIDSGRTRTKWLKLRKPFHALVDKTGPDAKLGWIQFPWESSPESDVEDSVVRLLQFIGENPNREGLRDSPARVVKAWVEMTGGYRLDPTEILKRDFAGQGYDEMILCRDIEFYSTCEHHLLPFVGVVHVAYVPRRRVVGLSKMARLVDCFARRLQIQERLTKQIADAMTDKLNPRGVGVIVKAKHLCMACRGVMKHKAEMITCSLTGVFRKPEVRAEFMAHCR